MKILILSVLMLCTTLQVQAQDDLWSLRNFEELQLQGTQYIYPDRAACFHVDYQVLKASAFKAPLEDNLGNVSASPVVINVPMPDGSLTAFKIVESPVYEMGLTEKYPEMKTFLGYNPNHPTWSARFDITPAGFHGMILGTDKGTIFIDPIMHLGDINHYFSYYKDDFKRENEQLICHLDEEVPFSTTSSNNNGIIKSFGSCELRTYRLAVSATGEYTAFHGGSVAQALAAQVTTMNRVNGVFERDISIRMNLIANNDLIIYTNAGTDPFTNGNAGAMINQNQTNTDAVIGSANYDIGHIFGTNSGGLAQLYSPCSNNKARGVTGGPAPIGDPFDIDYVSHEMGHQFGANHTQNNSCNRNGATAIEPGSASTIMGYAGICNPNIQNNSDDYFHGISIEEMGNFITSSGHNCPVKTPLSNLAPTVTIPQTTINIPASTPFSLTALATDPNSSNTLTYCWEQMDNAVATMPPTSSNTDGPAFRSLDPSTSPTRYFPNLPDVIAGNNPTWEVLPSVTRSMDFRVMVRDNAPGGGCNDHADITVEVDGNAGPFIVTNPNNSGITWTGNTNTTVSWDVANTDLSPVSCSSVNILISYDGGLTFPDTLASNVPNDGSQVVSVPNIGTSDALIIVQCANGTFFDVSNNTFTINPIIDDFTLNLSNPNQTICAGENVSFDINIGFVGTFNDNVSLSLTGSTVGTSFSISPNNQAPPYNSTLTITNTAAVSGNFNLTLNASSSTGIKSLPITLTILARLSGTVNLISPSNGETGVSSPSIFSWTAIPNADFYNITLATDLGLTSVIENSNGLTSESYTSGILPANTTVYWQVEAVNACDTITSSTFSFTTINCITYNSADIPVNISNSGTPTVSSNLLISGSTGIINDLNVVSLSGNHSYISDLSFILTSPSSTVSTLLSNICNNQNNFDIQFDDLASNNNYPCPPTDGLSYQPEDSLSAFNGENANGTWILTIDDAFNQDGGQLSAWGIEVCYAPLPCSPLTETINLTGCDSVLFQGDWFDSDTVVDVLIQGVGLNSCDSLISYNLNVNYSSTTFANATSCDPANVGVSSVTNPNQFGCDSVHTITTTFLPTSITIENIIECDSVFVAGIWIVASSTFNDTIISGSANGCDSIITYNILVNNSTQTTEFITFCDSLTWIDGVTYTSDNNTATYTIQDGGSNGCDSIVNLDLTIETDPNISISYSNGVLTASAGLSVYQWYRNGQAIPGANNQTYTPISSGSYTCSAFNSSCQGFSNAIDVPLTGINDTSFEYIRIYPNPVSDVMRLDLGKETLSSLKLIDVAGRVVANLNTLKRAFDMKDYARGMYFIELSNEDKQSIVKIVLK
ncbi:M12 family metallo-peptidase [Chitinophagales bacterium]|nr:M12 family metallo-peptidase [Chitinophagales bacterium]